MATVLNPRTVETIDLDQFSRQLFQFYFNERKSISRLTGSFAVLFQRLAEATGILLSVNERQWDNRAKKWMKQWGLTKAQQGEQVPMPESLRTLPLWYENDQPIVLFHACTPEKCNNCESSKKQSGTGQHFRPATISGYHQCPTYGTTCAICAIPIPPAPQDMTDIDSPASMMASYATEPNSFDGWPPVSGGTGAPLSLRLGEYPSNIDFQGHSLPLSQYNFTTANPGHPLPYHPPDYGLQTPTYPGAAARLSQALAKE